MLSPDFVFYIGVFVGLCWGAALLASVGFWLLFIG